MTEKQFQEAMEMYCENANEDEVEEKGYREILLEVGQKMDADAFLVEELGGYLNEWGPEAFWLALNMATNYCYDRYFSKIEVKNIGVVLQYHEEFPW